MSELATISLEAKKDGLQQRQDGSWLLRLRLHPHDDIAELSKAPMGQRFAVVLCAIKDDETPEEKPVNKLVQRCAILCEEQSFKSFLEDVYPLDWHKADGDAVSLVRSICGVQSRRELATNSIAAAEFEEMLRRFEGWKRGYED